ncbi:Imm10 family immunity protein [Pseudomonas entomophila]|uniref:Imm10 family immunity protein n=1 Tax=Pseudomonas entomophila TaxID=312306 RepID=UPI0024073D7A|nr:Imm10 family immunity protein [Pseudomonas entomophila]MDF9619097.1 Imm10 family immunity protein [Pseudomonas entomophila]
MNKRFAATYFDASSEDEVITVGFADSHDEPSEFIILQRADEVDEQDEDLEQDTYYVEMGEPGVAGYGGIEKVEVFSEKIILSFLKTCDWVKPLNAVQIDISNSVVGRDDIYAALDGIFMGEVALIRR